MVGGAAERVSALIGMGRPGEAAEVARAALAASPEDPTLTLLLAIALGEAGELTEALAAAEHAVALRPDSGLARRTLGWTIYKQGRYPAAAAELAESLTLDPGDAEAHVMLGEALLRQTQRARLRTRKRAGLLAQTEHHATEATRLAPASPGGYLLNGKVCVARTDAAGAEAWAHQALALAPDNPVGHQLLGLAAQISGDVRGAADHYVNAGRLNSHSDSSLRMLRGLRSGLPLSGLVTFLLVRTMLGFGDALGGVAVALGVLAAVLVVTYRWVAPRRRARRQMSPEARRVLDRDRELRGRSWSWPWARGA
jgi:Flp pilus assembly protein TadD